MNKQVVALSAAFDVDMGSRREFLKRTAAAGIAAVIFRPIARASEAAAVNARAARVSHKRFWDLSMRPNLDSLSLTNMLPRGHTI